MPHYYFTIRNGHPVSDPTGEDLPSPDAARRVAVEIMSEVMAGRSGDLLPEGRLSVEVLDHEKKPIFSVVTTTAVR